LGEFFLTQKQTRLYPNSQVLSQVLGFIGQQGSGLEGIESRFEAELSGESKKVELKKDARGVPLILNGQLFTQRPHGYNLQLTVDLELQYTLEQELKAAMENYDADSAVGIVLQADSSEVLAMASYPTFDPNQYQLSTSEQKRDRAVSDPFEPGSVMKAFTLAGAIRDKIVNPNTRINCENGKFKVGPYWIHEADAHHSFESLTVTGILEKSSNVGTSKVALMMGDKRLLSTLKDFGFGEKYDMGLPGESRGILPSTPWKPHMLANISFGHTLAATPLQIANGYAAIANGGILRRPFVVKGITDIEGNEIEKYSAQDMRRVLSPEDAQKMVKMLEAVTGPDGTGQKANVDGFTVAGKTGTAQKIDPVNGGYMKGAYISSFAGFIPAKAPKYVIYVAVDNPRKAFYGAEVAAPIFSKVASFAMMKEGTLPTLTQVQKDSRKRNNKIGNEKNRKAIDKVARQAANPEDMPDVVGISLREALQVLQRNDIDLKVYGQGQVWKTEPAAGEKLAKAQAVKIFLSRDE
jgi:cell division protein FtsI (penicillin-binding protein 3)